MAKKKSNVGIIIVIILILFFSNNTDRFNVSPQSVLDIGNEQNVINLECTEGYFLIQSTCPECEDLGCLGEI